MIFVKSDSRKEGSARIRELETPDERGEKESLDQLVNQADTTNHPVPTLPNLAKGMGFRFQKWHHGVSEASQIRQLGVGRNLKELTVVQCEDGLQTNSSSGCHLVAKRVDDCCVGSIVKTQRVSRSGFSIDGGKAVLGGFKKT
jgi:hypothetical protein